MKGNDYINDMPANCRAAADRMENALREEECCGCRPADITDDCKCKIDALEKELGKACGKEIILVAYQKK